MKKDRVKYHIPTDQIGVWIPDTVFDTSLFLFAEYEEDEVCSSRFCNFIEDKNDPKAFKRKDFIDLGIL